jgi:hypothetical protein
VQGSLTSIKLGQNALKRALNAWDFGKTSQQRVSLYTVRNAPERLIDLQ